MTKLWKSKNDARRQNKFVILRLRLFENTKIITFFVEKTDFTLISGICISWSKGFLQKENGFRESYVYFFHEKPSRGLDIKKEPSSIKAN